MWPVKVAQWSHQFAGRLRPVARAKVCRRWVGGDFHNHFWVLRSMAGIWSEHFMKRNSLPSPLQGLSSRFYSGFILNLTLAWSGCHKLVQAGSSCMGSIFTGQTQSCESGEQRLFLHQCQFAEFTFFTFPICQTCLNKPWAEEKYFAENLKVDSTESCANSLL